MNVKTETKEKFTVITPKEAVLSANMTEELAKLLLANLENDIPHLILNLSAVKTIDKPVADTIAGIQQQFYENNASFIVCALQKEAETLFKELNLLNSLNVTATESEAWDIVQMEEIERELMNDFDNNAEA